MGSKEKKTASKKAIVWEALQSSKPVPVSDMAKRLYNDDSFVGCMKVINLLSAYRAYDERFRHVRVRDKHIQFI